ARDVRALHARARTDPQADGARNAVPGEHPADVQGVTDTRTYTLNCVIRSSSGSAPRPGPSGTSTPPLITGTALEHGVAPKSANSVGSGDCFSFAARQCNTARKAGPI